MEENLNTEAQILLSAEKTFLENGYDGTSMQKIANEAGINKALLHYYFRSKDKLFETVFLRIFGKLIPPILDVIVSDQPFERKIELFVDHYISTIQQNPLIPVFILHELTRNPDKLLAGFRSTGFDPAVLIKEVESEIRNDNLAVTDARELLINVLSLCIFPFASKPLLTGFFFQDKEEDFNIFIEKRKKSVSQFVLNAIKKK